MKYEPIIGLEVHLQVKTKSKMFCGCNAAYFNQAPNTHVCPVCLGLPGALPVPNKIAIERTLQLALALQCDINRNSKFDRKNYFYPDLPKGYQISQYDLPVGYNGYVEIEAEGDNRRIRIRRVHIEEDTGKSLHDGTETLLDFNKSGVALIEIVTEPDFVNVVEVRNFAKRLRQIVRYLGISDADMEKGQMRFELNMSLRETGKSGLPPYKVEVKNIGSISVLEKVIATETERQGKILDEGKTPEQETRGLRGMSGQTASQRVKEEADDYRYFPEPDIPPIVFEEGQIQEMSALIGELPQERKNRYVHQLGLEPDTAETIIAAKNKADWFETAIADIDDKKVISEAAKWFIGDLMGLLKADKAKLKDLSITPENFIKLIKLLTANKLSGTLAKQVLGEMYKRGKDPDPEAIVKELGLEIIDSTDALKEIVDKVIAVNSKVVADITKNPNALQFLVGQVMRETRGKAHPKVAEQILKEALGI